MASTPINEGRIISWYKGRHIFVTGGSGFMGKVLIEKLLYSCQDIGNIYILMRSKRGRTPEQRVDDMWKLPMFNRLRESNANAKQRIIPLNGDLVTDGLGLSVSDLKTLVENVSVVFHCAATLKLEATLKDAIEQNTAGTQRVVDVVKQIKQLAAFLHLSTAFCSADIDVFEEKVYPCPDNPRDVIEVCRWMRDDALVIATPSLIAPHPNTYTYSKRLAETLVANEAAAGMRVAIVRPSIVTPAGLEPLEGWVDTLNGPMGLIAAGGKGVLRSMHAKGENSAQTVPVDLAINAMIIIAYKLGAEKETPKEVPVYNLTNDGVLHITWDEVLTKGKKVCRDYPFEQMIWYPDGDIRSSYFIHQLFCIFFHWLPAYFIDFLMFIFRQKRFMVRIQNKIHDGLELLQFFTTREWKFASANFLALEDELSPAEKLIFSLDFTSKPIDEYLKNCILGTRVYCLKEDLKSLRRCRIQQAILYVVHKVCVYGFYAAMIWMIYSYSYLLKDMFELVGEYVQHVPIIGGLIATH